MDAVIASAGDHSLNQYGSGAGLPDLVKALKQKLVTQNGLTQVHIFDSKERKRKVYAFGHHTKVLCAPSPGHICLTMLLLQAWPTCWSSHMSAPNVVYGWCSHAASPAPTPLSAHS